MMRRLLLLLLVVPGCFVAETGIARQAGVAGTRDGGGIQLRNTASGYYETGTQNFAVGGYADIVMMGEDRTSKEKRLATLGIAARYAHQLFGETAYRGYARASLGVGRCQVASCKPDDEDRDARHAAYGGELGVERLFWLPRADRPQDSAILAAQLGIVYTHTADDMLGAGDFVGLELGFRLGVSLLAHGSFASHGDGAAR